MVTPLGTRALSIVIAPGTEPSTPCPRCHERVRFQARQKQRKVVCNLYATAEDHAAYERMRIEGQYGALAPWLPPGAGGVWDRVEEWHAECYEAEGQPYGTAEERKAPQTAGRRPKAAPAA